MTYKDAVKEFKQLYADLYNSRSDYWKAQEIWLAYTDSLCKSGQITSRQYNIWKTPFRFAKNLKPLKTHVGGANV